MDEFDVIDAVYNVVNAANTGLVVYKDSSKTGETTNHIVINNLQFNELDYINVVPVNINIFIKLADNGMVDRTKMKTVKRAVRTALDGLTNVSGKYLSPKISFSARIPEAKQGFDCINIRVLISTDK